VSIPEIITLLEEIRNRKGMWIGTNEARDAQGFITGFVVACQKAGVPCEWKDLHLAGTDRGWKSCAAGPILEMQSRGMSDEAIADELFNIAIRAFQRAAESVPNSQASPPNPPKNQSGPDVDP
jgi:hypothetical protein